MPQGLLVLEGTDKGEFFPLTGEGTVFIGRSRTKPGILLHDKSVSRAHCQLEVAGNRILLTDLGSLSGTFVNGQKITTHELQPGDVITIGRSQLRLEAVNAEKKQGSLTPKEALDNRVDQPSADSDEPELASLSSRKLVPTPHLPANRMHELADYRLGRYEIGRVLGRGHFGMVFHARDVKRNNELALKILYPGFRKTEDEKKRFIRAMKAMLPLQHPNILRIYGAGKTRQYVWIAREYVKGKSLTHLIKDARTGDKSIKWKRGFRVAVHIARALDFARRNHLLHRNITPNNILWDSTDKVAKIGDFKFISALEGSWLMEEKLERKFLMELPYLAPEQMEEISYGDDLSDIYSLGAVVYATLTGRPPLEGKTIKETVRMISDVEPVKPRKYQKTIPTDFERVVLHMLAKKPEDRYQTPAELLADLDQLAVDEGLNA